MVKLGKFLVSTILFSILVAACSASTPAAEPTPFQEGPVSDTVPVGTPPRELPAPPPSPTPRADTQPIDLREAQAEAQRLREEFLEQHKDKMFDVSEIRTLELRGKAIELPPDVRVTGIISHILCVSPGCSEEELPYIQLERGNSIASVSAKTGRIVEEKIAPGEEGAFDFIREAMR
ncbi:MAG: hypothetical protein FJ312_04190 [SAR202 cluster bacterium]|nr:hypothetical protein [SAR202 cluster bacterium]